MRKFTVHGWNYRRYLVQTINHSPKPNTLEISPLAELVFTSNKISSNFSNFSALALPFETFTFNFTYFDEVGKGTRIEKGTLWFSLYVTVCIFRSGETKRTEFNLIKQAIYTEPDDQSVWIYYRWLVSIVGDFIDSKGNLLSLYIL